MDKVKKEEAKKVMKPNKIPSYGIKDNESIAGYWNSKRRYRL